jgi:hypothetical protein
LSLEKSLETEWVDDENFPGLENAESPITTIPVVMHMESWRQRNALTNASTHAVGNIARIRIYPKPLKTSVIIITACDCDLFSSINTEN